MTEEDMQFGFEEAMPLMPSQVVAEAYDYNSKVFFAQLILSSFFFLFFL